MKHLFVFLVSLVFFLQRGQTGDFTFAHRFPVDVVEPSSASKLVITNTTDHDIIALVRGQYNEYLRHVYIRSGDEYTFKEMPITRFYVQFKSKEFYYEDIKRTVINFGEKHSFEFFYDPSQEATYKQITEEDFFRH